MLIVQAHPSARRVAVGPLVAGALKVHVTAAPERGKANRAIRDLLADHFDLRKSQVELLAGATGHSKRFLLRGVTVSQLQTALRGLSVE